MSVTATIDVRLKRRDPDSIRPAAFRQNCRCRVQICEKLVQTIAAANPARVRTLKQAARRFGELCSTSRY